MPGPRFAGFFGGAVPFLRLLTVRLFRDPRGLPTFAPLARIGRLPLVAGMVEPGYRCFADNRARFAFLAGSFRAGSFGSAQGIRRR